MRETSNIFELKSTRILRCLLVNVGQDWTVRELAKEAGTSVGHTHAVLTALTNMHYVVRNDVNRLCVTDADILLKRWAAYYQYNHANIFLQFYTFEQQVDKFIPEIAKKLTDEEYALTSLAAAWIVSPYVRPVDVHFYVKTRKKAEQIANLLDIKPTAGTGNVKIVIPPDNGVFYGSRFIEGAKIVSNVQLFVDLWNYPSRGEDAAKRIYELIEKDWSRTFTGDSNVRQGTD